jgi:hypothetical protein
MMCIMFITLLNREVTSMKPPKLCNRDDKCVEMVKGNGEAELKAQRHDFSLHSDLLTMFLINTNKDMQLSCMHQEKKHMNKQPKWSASTS